MKGRQISNVKFEFELEMCQKSSVICEFVYVPLGLELTSCGIERVLNLNLSRNNLHLQLTNLSPYF